MKLSEKRISHRKSQKQMEMQIRERLKSIPGIEMAVGFDKPIYVAILGPDADKLQDVIDSVMKDNADLKKLLLKLRNKK